MNLPDLSPELLRSFIAVAETGGFSRAATSVHLTQSAVSLHVKRLEAQLGVRLFDRTSRRVSLTAEGGALLPYARRLIHLQQAAQAAIGEAHEAPAVRVGITDDQADAYLREVLPAFALRFPTAQLAIVCDLSPNLVRRLHAGELDLALAIRHGDEPQAEPVLIEDLVWVAARNAALRPDRPIPLAVNPEGCTYRARALDALTRIGRPWKVVYESRSPTAIDIAVASGLAVTIKAARSVPEGCRVLDGPDALPDLPPAAVDLHRASTAVTDEAEGFAALLLAAVKGEPVAA